MSTNTERLAHELDKANDIIRDRGALVTERDGTRWVDTTKLDPEFASYYAGLCTVAHAAGSTATGGE